MEFRPGRKIQNKTARDRKFTAASIRLDFKRNKTDYLMVLPTFLFFVVFSYFPMYGILMAFSNYKAKFGIIGSLINNYVGFENFQKFFDSIYFGRLLGNTLAISILSLIINFPASIILALLLNEVKNKFFSKTVSLITYMPHFISMVILGGILVDFSRTDGVLGVLLQSLTGKSQNLLAVASYWRTLYIGSDLWQNLGFSTILFVAALSSVDKELYEAAALDGAGHFKQMVHVTLPGILNTIIVVLILRVGMVMGVGADKTILLYNSQIYEKADIISSYVYRRGLLDGDYSFTTAVGLFNSVVSLLLVLVTNKIAKTYSEYSLF